MEFERSHIVDTPVKRRIVHVGPDHPEASSRRHVLRAAGFDVMAVSDPALVERLANDLEADVIVLEPGGSRTPELKQQSLHGIPVLDLELGWSSLLALSQTSELGMAVAALLRLNATEQALRESDTRFRSVADAAPVLIWSSDVEGLRDYFNQPWLQFTGRCEHEELHEGWKQGVHQQDRERYFAVYRDALAAHCDFEIEYRLLHRDGNYRWLLERGVPRYTPDGIFAGYAGSCTDITERKNIEAERERLLKGQVALRELAEAAERRSGLLAEISDLLSAGFDSGPALERLASKAVPLLADCCVIDLLNQCGKLHRVGASLTDPDTRALEVLLDVSRDHSEAQSVSGPLMQAVRTRKPVVVEQVSRGWMRQAGISAEQATLLESLSVHALFAVPLLAFGEPLGVIGFLLTDPKRDLELADIHLAQEMASRIALGLRNRMLFEEAETAREQAEKASRVKDEFLATISHELRQPVHAISGWVRLLRTGKLSTEKATHALQMIEQNVILQSQIVRDLLDVSAMITGQFYLDLQSMALAPAVAAAVDSVRAVAEAKSISLCVDLDESGPPVRGDASRLQQAVWNLLYNAIKFTPRGGSVEVSLRVLANEAQIRVADNGPGIDADFLPYVFEHFRQQDSTTTRKHGGLGLGLAIVRHVAELHGGRVGAQNIGSDGGALFMITLPLEGAQSLQPLAAVHEHP
jgi:PAS domain S-box-containing protein